MGHDLISLNQPARSRKTGDTLDIEVVDTLADPSQDTMLTVARKEEWHILWKSINAALPYMSLFQRQVLDQRLTDDDPVSLSDLAKRMGYSSERIRETEKDAYDIVMAAMVHLGYATFDDMRKRARNKKLFNRAHAEMSEGVIAQPELLHEFCKLASVAKPLMSREQRQVFEAHFLKIEPDSFSRIAKIMRIGDDTCERLGAEALSIVFAVAVADGRVSREDMMQHVQYPDVFDIALRKLEKLSARSAKCAPLPRAA